MDTSLANYESLETQVRDGVGIVEFDGSKDGLAQIAQWAAAEGGYDTIHILSHGSEGALLLGATRLDTAALADNHTQAELAQLGRALSADGDLLLYGCDVGDNGALLAGLAQATGADVAASTDLTGAARLGGNWTLEAQVGTIDSRELALAQYDGVLDTIHFTYGADANDTVPVSVINRTIGSQAFTFSAGEIYDYNDGLGIYALSADQQSVTLTVSVAAGYSFDLTSFRAQGFTSSGSITVTFANSNTPLTFGFSGIGTSGTLTTISGFSTPLNDVRSVTIRANDYTTLQDIVITDVQPAQPVAKANNATMKYDSGTAGDFITNVAGQEFSGTLTANLDTGARVQVSYDNGANWRDASNYTAGSNAWKDTGVTIAGSNTFQVRTVSVSGVASTAHTHAYQLDQSPPTTTFSNYSFSNDTGASATDLITKNASQTIGATLSSPLDSSDAVWASTDNGINWTNVTSKVSGTTLTWTGATLSAAGTQVVKLKVTDQAGNDGNASSKAYVLDTIAPGTTVSTLALSNDSNIAGDFYTNIASQTVTGTLSANVASGESVYVSLDNGASWSAASAAVGQNTFSLSGVTLAASNSLKVKVSDLAGNDGTARIQAYVYDTTAPPHSATNWALSTDNGASQTDFITNVASQTVTVTLSTTLAAYETVYGSTDGGASWSDITSKVSGTVVTWAGVTLSGSNTLQLKVLDQAGNSGTVQSKAYVLDTGTPAAPPTPTLVSDTGVSASDGITYDTTPTLSGTAEDGSTVTVYDGATKLGTTIASGGMWSYTAGTLSQGSHSITVTATDVAGNVSIASGDRTITIDAAAPTVASVSVPASTTYYSGESLDFTVNYNENVYVDTSGGTPRIALDVGGVTRYATYLSGSGSSTLVFRYIVVNGDTDADGITVGALSVNNGTLTDLAGNDSVTTLNSTGSTASVLVDGSQPSITNVSSSTANGSYGAGSTISITVSFSTAVEVNTTGGIPTLALSSGGTATYFSGGGSNTLVFHYTVAAGQNSADLDYANSAALSLNNALIYESNGAGRAASVTLLTPGTAGSLGANRNLVIDTTAPTITGATLTFSEDTGNSATDLVTRQAGQTEIHGTLDGALGVGEVVKVSLDNGVNWLTATASGSNWSIGARTLSGSNTALVRVIDAAGNIGGSASFGYMLDQSAPTNTFGTIRFSSDTGSSNTDLNTNATAQTVSATLSSALTSGELVFGSYDSGNTWSDITSQVSGTTLTWTGVTLASSNTLQFYVRDLAGNDGTITYKSYVLDTSAPGTSVSSAGFSDDTGSSNSDFITKVGTQTISGTLSANLLAGETVYVSTDNGGTWQAATSDGLDGWSVSNMSLTSVGANATLLVKVSDTAGNDGNILSQAYTYDTTAPTAASVTPLTTPSLTPVLSGSATLAPGDSMTVSVGGATYDVTPVAGAWTLDLASAVPASGALTLVLNNQYNVVATITDAAGNSSNDATSGELVVGTLTQPAVPPTTSAGNATLSNDSGASNSDWITNVAQQTISGSLSAPLQASERIEVSLDGGATWSNATASGSSWSISATLASSGTLQVRVSGDGGTGPVYSRAYTLDITTPGAPVVDVQTSSSLAPILSGASVLADGETLSISVGGAEYAVNVVNGRWALDLASATPTRGALALVAGSSYSVEATITDLAGNRNSSSGTLTIRPLPTVTGMALSADTGNSSSDFVTNVAAQIVTGSLSASLLPGQVVQVSVDGGVTWEAAISSGSNWTASITLNGSNTLLARVGSDRGSSAPFQQAYVLDTSVPTAMPTLVSQATDGLLTGSLSMPLGAGETLLASVDGGATWSVVGINGQTWTLRTTGAQRVQMVVRDAAGNNGAMLTVDVLTPPPILPAPSAVPVGTLVPPLPISALSDLVPVTTQFLSSMPTNSQATEWGSPLAWSMAGWPDMRITSVADTREASAYMPANVPASIAQGRELVVLRAVGDVISDAEGRLDWRVPDTVFGHVRSGAEVRLSLSGADGQPLPSWVRFDVRTGRLQVEIPPGFKGELTLRLTARDNQGNEATTTFKLKSRSNAGDRAAIGRAGLGEQFQRAAQQRAGQLAEQRLHA